jgi:hypothetical protein
MQQVRPHDMECLICAHAPSQASTALPRPAKFCDFVRMHTNKVGFSLLCWSLFLCLRISNFGQARAGIKSPMITGNLYMPVDRIRCIRAKKKIRMHILGCLVVLQTMSNAGRTAQLKRGVSVRHRLRRRYACRYVRWTGMCVVCCSENCAWV